MIWTWNENTGIGVTPDAYAYNSSLHDDTTGDDNKGAIGSLKDMRIWVLSFASCCFEGAIFIFTFFWPGTLQEAHDREHPVDHDATPYGVVFATFMASMVLGAILFGLLTHNPRSPGIKLTQTLGVMAPTLLLGMALLISAFSFLIAAFSKAELRLFLSFLLLEACNGVYVPSMAYHRSMIVKDSSRALVYGLMNIPLFIFVIVALATTTSGDRGKHGHLSCSRRGKWTNRT